MPLPPLGTVHPIISGEANACTSDQARALALENEYSMPSDRSVLPPLSSYLSCGDMNFDSTFLFTEESSLQGRLPVKSVDDLFDDVDINVDIGNVVESSHHLDLNHFSSCYPKKKVP